jgi:hypothetical protein
MQSNRDKEAARATAAEEQLEKLGRYRGDDPSLIVSSLDEYLTWKTNPDVQKAIEKVISGGNASPEGDGTEEFLTDEQKEIRELRQENAQIKQRLAGTELSFGQQALTGHIEKMSRDYSFTPELHAKAQEVMKQYMEGCTRTGDRGAAAIQNIMQPGGYDAVKAVVLSKIEPKALLDAQQNRDRRKQEGLAGLATDGLPGQASTGREPPPKFASAIDAARWSEQNPEGHDSY